MSIVSQTSTYKEDGTRLISWQDPISPHDPDLSQHLKEADILIPCGHSISHATAQKLFGLACEKLLPNGRLKMWTQHSTQSCPECLQEVSCYIPNFTLRNMEDSLRQIQDLFTLNPLRNAVALVPCGDSLSKDTAQHLYGHAKEMGVERPGECIACNRQVFSYVPNKTLRNIELLSRQILLESSLFQPNVLTQASKRLPKLPFPGKGAHFDCLYPWGLLASEPNGFVQNSITFQSFTPDAFLTKASVYEDRDGCLFASVTCQGTHIQTFRTYLMNLGVMKDCECFRGVFYARLPHELDWLLHFLTQHNTFSDRHAHALLIYLLKTKKSPS